MAVESLESNVPDTKELIDEVEGRAAESEPLSADEGIETLRRQLADERAKREAAELRADQAAANERRAKSEVDESNKTLIDGSISTLKDRGAAIEAALADAINNHEGARAAKLQREMADNSARLLQLENGKAALAEQRANVNAPTGDPVEDLVRNNNLSSKSANWLRAHPEFVTDQTRNRKMVRAHGDAVDDGLTIDTPEYFAYIESRLGLRRQETPEDGEEARPARRETPAAAPVSRSGSPASDGSTKRVVRLSAEEREVAQMSGMTDLEYWQEKQKMLRERMN